MNKKDMFISKVMIFVVENFLKYQEEKRETRRREVSPYIKVRRRT